MDTGLSYVPWLFKMYVDEMIKDATASVLGRDF